MIVCFTRRQIFKSSMDHQNSRTRMELAPPDTLETELIHVGRSVIQLATGELIREGRAVLLGRRALRLLSTLAQARGKMVSNDTLLQQVWGDRRRTEYLAGPHFITAQGARI